jgi:enamine deaminase RidA (YjgF/YER057c/UK114 family)
MRPGLAAPARHVFANLGRALAAAGAGPRHVAKITIYVAGHTSTSACRPSTQPGPVCSRTQTGSYRDGG